MGRRSVLIVVVAVLAVTAGCVGLSGDDDGGALALRRGVGEVRSRAKEDAGEEREGIGEWPVERRG